MRWKKYKPGDRIFYDCFYDKSIHTDIVLAVENSYYISDQGYRVNYQELQVDDHMFIENYNCLPMNDPRVKELAKKYAAYDKAKEKLQETVLKLLEPFDLQMKQDFLKELQIKLESHEQEESETHRKEA